MGTSEGVDRREKELSEGASQRRACEVKALERCL
jgi:hypothetical protein